MFCWGDLLRDKPKDVVCLLGLHSVHHWFHHYCTGASEKVSTDLKCVVVVWLLLSHFKWIQETHGLCTDLIWLTQSLQQETYRTPAAQRYIHESCDYIARQMSKRFFLVCRIVIVLISVSQCVAVPPCGALQWRVQSCDLTSISSD